MSVQFQAFEDDLLASVIYTLRYGTKFGFSGACYVKIDGGFLCEACVNDNCESSGEKFKIRWSGGDTRQARERRDRDAGEECRGRPRLSGGGRRARRVRPSPRLRRRLRLVAKRSDADHRRELQGERSPRARRPAAAAGAEPRPPQFHRQAGRRPSRRSPSSSSCASRRAP